VSKVMPSKTTKPDSAVKANESPVSSAPKNRSAVALLAVPDELPAITVARCLTDPATAAAGTINDVDVDITNKFAFLGTAGTAAEFQAVNIGSPAAMTLAKTVDAPGTTSTIGGISYSNSLDSVIAASAADTQEVTVFTRN